MLIFCTSRDRDENVSIFYVRDETETSLDSETETRPRVSVSFSTRPRRFMSLMLYICEPVLYVLYVLSCSTFHIANLCNCKDITWPRRCSSPSALTSMFIFLEKKGKMFKYFLLGAISILRYHLLFG